MAELIIKPAAVGDSFKMKDAQTNTILTVEGRTDAADSAAGRIIYGKGVNETKGVALQGGTSNAVITIDLATGTFFEWTLTHTASTWVIHHIPAAGTVAAWVVKLKQKASSPVTNAWVGAPSTYDAGSGTWSAVTPAFHWEGGNDHVMSTGVDEIDVLTFWTFDGGVIIYASVPSIFIANAGRRCCSIYSVVDATCTTCTSGCTFTVASATSTAA